MSEQEPIARGSLPKGRDVPPSAPATGTDTVTVACKITNGLILKVYEMVPASEPTFGGGERDIKGGKAIQIGEDVVLRGSALDPVMLRAGRMPGYSHVGGFALTSGIPREFWERWLEQNADHPAVRNGLVFAHATVDGASGMSREREGVESGYEGIDPANPSKRTGIRAVTQGERTPAR